MIKTFTKVIFCLIFSIKSFATANSIYHESTTNNVGGGCGTFVSNLAPLNTDAVTIGFTIDYQFFTNQARIYYTTDGSNPGGAFGVPTGTTQVITASYFCSFNNGVGTVDVAKGTIPALPTGTIVKYIVSAWHSSGGLEIFASGGTNTTSATATIFTYTVTSVLPISIINFSAKKETTAVKLAWSVATETNTIRYDIYSSKNCIDFKNIGTKKASENNSGSIDYTFTDINPANGNNYYKIIIVNKDGHNSYTNILSIPFQRNNIKSITVSGGILHLKLPAAQAGNYSATIFNNSGQTINKWNFTANNNFLEYSFILPVTLRQGIYHISLNGGGAVSSRSVFIQNQ